MSLTALTPDIARQLSLAPDTRGVVIASVDASGDAAAKGLRRGDLIVSINQRPTSTPAEANAAVDQAVKAGRTTVLLLVQRGNTPPRYIGIELKGK